MKTPDYKAGFKSGKKHGSPIVGVTPKAAIAMYADNERKIKSAKADPNAAPAVKEYWQGYADGMTSK